MAAMPVAPKLMHAVQYNCYGGGASGLEHVDIPIPAPKRDEVCLKLEAASLNPSDWKVQKGILWPVFPGKLPHVPVNDVAGEIIEVGQGVKKFKAGDKVVALLNLFNGGGLAEFSVASERLTVARPPEVSAAESAGLPIAGLTALQALTQAANIKLDGSGQQKNILITAASGGHVEIPIPTLKKDEVLLKLEAASLNPGDFKIQKGLARPFLLRKLPHTPVTDVAGEIVEVGKGVNKFKVGDKVVALLSYSNGGGLAEFAAAKEKSVVARPPEVSAAEGSSLPVAGLSAHQALTKDLGIKLDRTGELKNILITGAAGGVGLYAVQLAKLGNTHVTATCGARNIELVKSLGADEVLDYKTPEGIALKSPSGRKYDYVIHSASQAIPWSVFEANLSARGKVIDLTIGASNLFTFVLKKITFSKKKLALLIINPKTENLDCLVKLVKEGKLKTVIDSTHPLSRAEEAWAKRINSQCTGKIIVEPN